MSERLAQAFMIAMGAHLPRGLPFPTLGMEEATLAAEVYDVPERVEELLPALPDFRGAPVVLFSGGLDSTVAAAMRPDAELLYVWLGEDYQDQEAPVARMVADGLGRRVTFYTLPTLPWARWRHIRPARNLVLMALAVAAGAGSVVLSAVNGEVPERGGDKSKRFLELAEHWLGVPVRTLADYTKADLVKWWLEHDLDIGVLRRTRSCYAKTESGKLCGRCQACLRRYVAFAYSGIDTADDYEVHPLEGAREAIAKYRRLMSEALATGDFSHYSRRRCEQTLSVIGEG